MNEEVTIPVKLSVLLEMEKELNACVKPYVPFQENIDKMRLAAIEEMRQKAYQVLFKLQAILR